ncbi:MAG: nucleotidyltransferase family protein, partial [Dissulfurispiraceae bacterium]
SSIRELLVSALRGKTGRTPAERPGSTTPDEWRKLLDLSRRHRVSALLYRQLKEHEAAEVPPEIIQELHDDYMNTAAGNMRLYHQLSGILKLFYEENIPVIPLKGAFLAARVYGNISVRPMNDVDLLVKQTDLSRVQDILAAQGYAASDEKVAFSMQHLRPYTKKNHTTLEIHFNIVNPPFSHRVDIERLWARTQPDSIQGLEVLAMCPEDLLLHLCTHAGFKHGFENGIMPLFDISHTIRHYETILDWEHLLNRGREWGVSRCVFLALSLAKKIAGASVPEQIMMGLEVCNDGFDAATLAEEQLFNEDGFISENIARLFNNDSLLHKLKHFMNYIFLPKKVMTNLYPAATNKWSVYIFYIFRFKGLLMRHGRTVWHLLLRDGEISARADLANRKNTLKDWLAQFK